MNMDDVTDPQGTTTADGEGETFLHRWSRRKLNAEEEGIQAPIITETEHQETPPPDDDDMPPLESLDEESDFSGFLSPAVSESLRKLALRKLFHSPGFNLCDGLDDYDEDFRNFTALGQIATAEMRRRLEEAAEALEETTPQTMVAALDKIEDRNEPEGTGIDEQEEDDESEDQP